MPAIKQNSPLRENPKQKLGDFKIKPRAGKENILLENQDLIEKKCDELHKFKDFCIEAVNKIALWETQHLKSAIHLKFNNLWSIHCSRGFSCKYIGSELVNVYPDFETGLNDFIQMIQGRGWIECKTFQCLAGRNSRRRTYATDPNWISVKYIDIDNLLAEKEIKNNL